MADPSAPSTSQVDPYLTYAFRVIWDGNPVAAVSNVSGLSRKTAVVSFHAGGQPQSALKIPGRDDYEPIRLERGITTDSAFKKWSQLIWSYPSTGSLGAEMDLTHFRKDLQLELYNQAGQLVLRYDIFNCWPSEYVALPDLDSGSDTTALASLTLEHEGWERDMSVVAPT